MVLPCPAVVIYGFSRESQAACCAGIHFDVSKHHNETKAVPLVTLTTPVVVNQDPDLEADRDGATKFQPIVLSAQARERLKVLNQVLETAGPSEAETGVLAAEGQSVSS